MKSKIILTLFILLSAIISQSQDIITFKSGDELKVKIIEIGLNDIKYKKVDTSEGNPIYQVYKTSVVKIAYSNGVIENISEEKNYHDTTTSSTYEELYFKGEKDAEKYFKGYHGAGTGTFILSFLNPVLGLIPAIACSSTPPSEMNLGAPSMELMQKASYRNAYIEKSKHIKSGKVWTNWLIALLINVAAYVVYVYAL